MIKVRLWRINGNKSSQNIYDTQWVTHMPSLFAISMGFGLDLVFLFG